ncbi:hypothetical protein AN958_07080 [Leucoagaricus sp. SymC.cos]|nr:hypothetical protein AN958_07080 [Leucoagaricus sp. SymC.cos]
MAIIVLSRLEDRYFRDISDRSLWNLNFVLVKEGEKEPIAESVHAVLWSRSVNLEIELEAGKYFVYVRIDRQLNHRIEYEPTIDDWLLRKLSYLMTARAKSRSIASNFDHAAHANFIPTQLEWLIDRDYKEYQERKAKEVALRDAEKAKKAPEPKVMEDGEEDNDDDDKSGETVNEIVSKEDKDGAETITTTTTTTVVRTVKKVEKAKTESETKVDIGVAKGNNEGVPSRDARLLNAPDHRYQQELAASPGTVSPDPTKYTIKWTENDELYLGLRVYTHKDVPAAVVGTLRVQAEKKEEKPADNGSGDESKQEEEEEKKEG